MTPDGRIISNNAQLLAYAKLTITPGQTTSVRRHIGVNAQGARQAMDFADACSPTNPYYGSGPYVRQVSKCGFSAGWAFLKIPCGTTSLNNRDNGYAYFEVTAPANANHIEGGVFTPDGTTLDPYLRSDAISTNGGYETLTNSTARFTCNEQIAIWHGLTNSVPEYSFTEVGDASQWDPYTVWVDNQVVTLGNAAWLFGPVPSSFSKALGGSDGAGFLAPCLQCSISQVTSIAQDPTTTGGTWNADASEFGIDVNGNNAIQWLQVGFGNWASNCTQGTTLCTFDVSRDPLAYYGGTQAYPNSEVSGSNAGATGYGPYETVDGIQAYGGLGMVRQADIAISEPLPPPPCTLDAMGMCAQITSENTTEICYVEVWDRYIEDYKPSPRPYYANTVYAVYRSNHQLEIATKTISKDQEGCATISTSWSPSEPRITYNDASLP